jgi:hypothetical protein
MTPDDLDLAPLPAPGRNRAWRRMKRATLQQARRHYFVALLRWQPDELTFEARQRILGHVARTPKGCSCYGCANGRRQNGPNLQERRELERTRQAIESIGGWAPPARTGHW